jgi:hypothetical protein
MFFNSRFIDISNISTSRSVVSDPQQSKKLKSLEQERELKGETHQTKCLLITYGRQELKL